MAVLILLCAFDMNTTNRKIIFLSWYPDFPLMPWFKKKKKKLVFCASSPLSMFWFILIHVTTITNFFEMIFLGTIYLLLLLLFCSTRQWFIISKSTKEGKDDDKKKKEGSPYMRDTCRLQTGWYCEPFLSWSEFEATWLEWKYFGHCCRRYSQY